MNRTRILRAAVCLLATLDAVGTPRHLRAQGALRLTLRDALAMAVQQGPQARIALGTRDAARARDHVALSQYLPSLSVGGASVPTITRSITPVIQPDGTTLYKPLQQTTAGLTASVVQRVPWTNTTLNIASGLNQVQVNGAAGSRTWSSVPLQLSLTQPLLKANTYKWEIRQQALRISLAERRYLEAREDLSLAVTNAFFDVHGTALAVANAAKNAATNDTLFTLNKGRLEVGKIGENDLLQSELALLRSRSSIADALLAHQRALAQFRLVLSLPPGTPVSIVVSDSVPTFDADTTLAVEQARRNAAGMTDAEAATVQADRALSEARWNTGPGGNLQVSYGYNNTAGTAAAAYKDLRDAQQLQVGVQIPVWQWGTHGAQVQAAKSERMSAQTSAQNLRNQVELTARFAALQLGQARRALQIAAKADTVAAKRFEVALNRYGISRITIDNLYIAQSEKDQALSSYVQALRGYWQAYFQLRKATLYDFERGEGIR
ncbi:MAG: TolC family protein [Gemmatimonadaceae bacterium]|jgi:outer membrane protein TolC